MFINSSALRRGAAPLLSIGLCALVLGACGGSDPEPASSTEDDRDTARLKLTECLRENGVDIPDGPGQGAGAPVRIDRKTIEKAMEGPCKDEQRAAVGNITDEERQEFEDAFAKFSQCMRDNGVDVPDVTRDGGGGGPTRARVNGADPKVRAAQEKCQSKLPRNAPGGGGLVFGGGPR